MNPGKELYSRVPENLRFESTRAFYSLAERAKIPNPDMFTGIDVGLTDWCNRKCSYCPVSLDPKRHGRKGNILSEDAWQNLLGDLAAVNYSGRLSPHHYNEPLLDADALLLPRLQQAREMLPHCNIVIYTNGDLLPKYIDGLAKLKVGLVISIHEGRESIQLRELRESGELLKKIPNTEIKDLRVNALFDRTPQVPRDRVWHPIKCPNFSWGESTLVINPKGDVVTCVQDHDGEMVWGNINNTAIMDIWTQREFWEFREKRRLSQVAGMLAICHTCLGR